MNRIIVNCEKLPFGKTLGVSHFLINLCTALSSECELIYAVPDIKEFESSAVRTIIESSASDIVSLSEATGKFMSSGNEFVELLPHHFQEPKFAPKSIMICHDLHIYDIEWKYKNVEELRRIYKDNIHKASAVITHFPRTYYALERMAGIQKKSLYLTESPLLLDTRRPKDSHSITEHTAGNTPVLIFPAQLQEHKNHQSLIYAVSALKNKNQQVRIICPGTTFDDRFRAKLVALAKELDVEEDIVFAGRLSDGELRKLYWACDGVIIPSLAEGGAYVALEAIAAEIPVAVNRIDSAQQHIKSFGGKVHFFDANDVESTAVAINKLVSANVDDWRNDNTVARYRIDQATWERVAEKWFAVLRWLSGETDRPVVHVDSDGWNIKFDHS